MRLFRLVLLLATLALAPTASAGPPFLLYGRGSRHGGGMSQRGPGGAARLARSRVSRAGGRRADVRARHAASRGGLRPAAGHAGPDVRRDPRRAPRDEPRDRRDGGPRPHLRRARDRLVLLLDLGRPYVG